MPKLMVLIKAGRYLGSHPTKEKDIKHLVHKISILSLKDQRRITDNRDHSSRLNQWDMVDPLKDRISHILRHLSSRSWILLEVIAFLARHRVWCLLAVIRVGRLINSILAQASLRLPAPIMYALQCHRSDLRTNWVSSMARFQDGQISNHQVRSR